MNHNSSSISCVKIETPSCIKSTFLPQIRYIIQTEGHPDQRLLHSASPTKRGRYFRRLINSINGQYEWMLKVWRILVLFFSYVFKGFLIRNFSSRNGANACHFKCFTVIPCWLVYKAFHVHMVQRLCCDFL